MEASKLRHGSETAPNSNSDSSTSAAPRFRLSDLLHKKFDVRSIALTGLFVLAVFYTMYFIRAILLPLVLAVMLSYLLRPIVRAFARVRIIPAISSALILLSLLAAFGYGLSQLSAPASAWLEKAPYSLREFQAKLRPLRHPMEKMAQASGEIEKLTTPNDPHAKQEIEVKRHPITELLLLRTPEFITSMALLLILLYFLLSYDGVFLNKLIRILPTLSDKKRAVSIASDIEEHVSRYLLTVTLINICLGLAVGTTVGLLGLANPVMWGVMVALLNFIPYLGALTGIICITLGAVLSFPSFSYALIFPAVYLGFATLEGNFITPWVMGRSLTLNPVMILLSLIFWGWMWGIPGIMLAVPMLAAFKIFCSHVEGMESIAEFLS
jgi:predicted PurR-regulated permease PerM